jgi:hypothetical protein
MAKSNITPLTAHTTITVLFDDCETGGVWVAREKVCESSGGCEKFFETGRSSKGSSESWMISRGGEFSGTGESSRGGEKFSESWMVSWSVEKFSGTGESSRGCEGTGGGGGF